MNEIKRYLNEDNVLRSTEEVEYHPLIPFLPEGCKVLFLGSFPPQMKRWCRDFYFYYPNFINDHWRIEGLVFYGDKNHFVDEQKKTFRLESILSFLESQGIGFFDTSTAVRRLRDNASDKFLEVVERTDIHQLLQTIPECRTIVTTGEKATATLCETLSIHLPPKVGEYVSIPRSVHINKDGMTLYRLPSSSRAYPLSLDKKAEAYRKMFQFVGLVE